MNTLKLTWNKILLFFGAIAGIAFIVAKFFLPTPKSDLELVEDLFTAEKNRLNKEKESLEKEIEKTEDKKYTDKEIEDKFNK
jgi:hypothetical protein